MSKVEDFLTQAQEQDIIKAIKVAEKNTSGEIRVHIEKTTSKPPMDRALEVFYLLEMEKTEQRNGVLFYVAVESKKFAIIGDEGINSLVPENFWDSEKELVLSHFVNGQASLGLQLAIKEVGEKLKDFFPYLSNDKNELSDEISKG
ncbi:TLP18.3, Psb32 and MOLO-1 founding protein of phosphatase [Lutibacter oricola]|uniref:TLP18.3, Psb32 and MOLO-1 founding protein of phosphatase n=1 Tax=Lutibacter oricola TaxID=762486 RepID=A0A1H2T526_9FLAO|nr:TPM domain-containing protein [Lutibacter oricola]SDW38369.1 TLP18.3, Psb32 and MOLO-1 founding protein of phosphatase [Lutibacter oricola]